MTICLISKLSDFVQIGTLYSGMSAHANRIAEFCRIAEEKDYIRHWETPDDRDSGPAVVFSGLNIITPDEQCHIKDFDLRIDPGQHVYITGPNGSGKTSLVRTLMKLWRPTSGRVRILGNASVACAPQEAIVYSGTLLEQLGLDSSQESHDRAFKALTAVKLSSLPARTGGLVVHWPRNHWIDVMSPGELQRLAMARIMLQAPTFAVLDEATSAIDSSTERLIYEEIWRRGITTVTIGHRIDGVLMDKIYTTVTLDGEGGHAIQKRGEELIFNTSGRRTTLPHTAP